MEGMKDRPSICVSEPVANNLDVQIDGHGVLGQMRTYTGPNDVGEFAIALIAVAPVFWSLPATPTRTTSTGS